MAEKRTPLYRAYQSFIAGDPGFRTLDSATNLKSRLEKSRQRFGFAIFPLLLATAMGHNIGDGLAALPFFQQEAWHLSGVAYLPFFAPLAGLLFSVDKLTQRTAEVGMVSGYVLAKNETQSALQI